MAGRPLVSADFAGRLDHPLLSLLLAALLALWLLLRPEPIQALPMAWRLPLILVGAWALGTAFVRPMALEVGEGGLSRLAGAGLSRWTLWGFASVIVCLEAWR
ncbi:hypothetical protein RSO68_14965 [Halomonas saccharevitans]|uniref:Uncharacterized protein n=1 Tax=Halomonas saccharevitans TaxID=416872 RepID=A0ABU3NHX7_9GAMM|nr:hypothetical protein [Halomonas saccharevitans]MDT8880775.1 hypothetical protein [Halomonas saccharevitans]